MESHYNLEDYFGTGLKEVVVLMLKDYHMPKNKDYKKGEYVKLYRGSAVILVNAGYARWLNTSETVRV